MLGIDLVVVGPEVPLAAGLADRLRAEGRAVVRTRAAAAAASRPPRRSPRKSWLAAGVPTAASRDLHRSRDALAYVARHAEPLVVKASGLAAGKGAIVCATREEAAARCARCSASASSATPDAWWWSRRSCRARNSLSSRSPTARDVELLPAAQDHKRLLEGDTGPNTGGMGAYSPVTLATPELLERARRRSLPARRCRNCAAARHALQGVLYAGLMVDARRHASGRVQLPAGRPRSAGGAAAGGPADSRTRSGGSPGARPRPRSRCADRLPQ